MLILPVVMLYSAAAARWQRERIVYACVAVFIAASSGFWVFFSTTAPAWSHYAYFFYVDVFSSVMVALFWSFANDLTSPEQAKRTYGIIGAGGILGGAVGSSFTGFTVEPIGAANLLLVCIGILVAIALVARWIAALNPTAAAQAAVGERTPSLSDAVAGARL